MFELRTACSYLVPRKGQLSISVVGLIAVFVIAAITWLILVFFSTTEGIESRWSNKIIGSVGALRVVPTPSYYDSPLYNVDLFASATGCSPQRLSTKLSGSISSYDPSMDSGLPPTLQQWYQDHSTDIHPLAKLVQETPSRPFESTVCHLSLTIGGMHTSQTLNQYTCLLGLDGINPNSFVGVREITAYEVDRLLSLLASSSPDIREALRPTASSLKHIEVISKTTITTKGGTIPAGTRMTAQITFNSSEPSITLSTPNGDVASYSLTSNDLPCTVIRATCSSFPIGLSDGKTMRYVPTLGYPVFAPKAMRAQGASLLATGSFQFTAASATGHEKMSIPFYIAGFFDSGILPIGGRLVLTSRQAVMAIEAPLQQTGPFAASGIIFDVPVNELDSIQQKLQRQINADAPGLFSVEKFDQYDITKDLYQQLSSEKTLFRLLAIIIVIVACSNIFSMLFILAHDRRKEIAVLRALGASKRSITTIFLLSGLGVGLIGALTGSALAALTLKFLPEILSIIGQFQGHEILNQGIYGDLANQTVHRSTFLFSLCSIGITASIAGGLAAVRACTLNISEALRS